MRCVRGCALTALSVGDIFTVRACYPRNYTTMVEVQGSTVAWLAERFELDSQFADEPEDELDALEFVDEPTSAELFGVTSVSGPDLYGDPDPYLATTPAGLATVGVKYDTGKPPIGLIPVEAQFAEAEVLAYGAKKYAAHNWRMGMNWTRLSDAALRHILAWVGGEDLDPETGLSHLAHARCDLGFLLGYAATGAGTDDRWKAAA